MGEPLLQIDGLTVEVESRGVRRRLLDSISLSIARGETVGLVGESGSGKSLTAQAIMHLLPSPPMHITAGRMVWEGQEISRRDRHDLCGREIAMIFQDPTVAFNPIKTIGKQIGELPLGDRSRRRLSLQEQVALLESVGIDRPAERLCQYPHELSGGICQRAFIAMAIAHRPKLLIADEATTALDPTVELQVLRLLCSLQREHQMSLLLITHDLRIAAALCQRVCVMHEGRVVEVGPAKELLSSPRHPYTQKLVEAAR